MSMDKADYIRTLCNNRYYIVGQFKLYDIALVYYHSGIPLEDASIYMENLIAKDIAKYKEVATTLRKLS